MVGADVALGAASAVPAKGVDEDGALEKDAAVRGAGARRGSLVYRVGVAKIVDLARVERLIDSVAGATTSL